MRIELECGAYEPTRAHPTDAGMDIYAMYTQTIPARGYSVFHTGVHIELPHGTVGLIKSKSGLNVNSDIITTGVIDEGYSGGIVVKLYNLGKNERTIHAGEKIAQLLVMPVLYEDIEIVPKIKGGARGDKGFGSTGV